MWYVKLGTLYLMCVGQDKNAIKLALPYIIDHLAT